jgi:hypothetical protein
LILLLSIVLLNRKTFPLSKTIDSAEAILAEFLRLVKRLRARGVEVKSTLVAGGAELRLTAPYGQNALLKVKPLLHPSRKILTLASDADPLPRLVACAHIPDRLAADLRRNGINHGDLNGRLFIQAPGFVVDLDSKGESYRNWAQEPGLFSPKTSRIARALLSHRAKSWGQAELTERTKVSRGLVSRIMTSLITLGYVLKEKPATRHSAASYRLDGFDYLLRAWEANDAWRKRVRVQQYSVLAEGPGEIARTVRDALGRENVSFTQWFAAHLRHPYATPPIVSAYVPKGRRLPNLRFAREVRSGGNLWLIAPNDEGVFFEWQEIDGFRLVSDVQIYLDLVQMGQRGPDAAEALRAWEGFAR